jgi:hypothetical protein
MIQLTSHPIVATTLTHQLMQERTRTPSQQRVCRDARLARRAQNAVTCHQTLRRGGAVVAALATVVTVTIAAPPVPPWPSTPGAVPWDLLARPRRTSRSCRR